MFTQKISMDCTKEQYEKYLKDELLKMGYKEISINNWHCQKYQYICNNYEDANGSLGTIHRDGLKRYNRTYLGSFNAPLFLALAAMTDSERVFGYRELAKQKNGNVFKLPQVGENYNPYWRKATKEEIMEKFGNEEIMEKFGNEEPMWKSYSNTTKNLEEIYTAIELLKSKGYKILKPTTWEEV